LRTGPLIRRGAKVSRATHANSTTLRASAPAALFDKRPQDNFPASEDIFQSSRLHLECRLPINLREFLAIQLGAVVDESDETVLRLAATADETTLSRLARAIRRYSTTRAQQSWEETATPLARLIVEPRTPHARLALCLKCVRIEFGEGALERHQTAGCVSLALDSASETRTAETAERQELRVADSVRHLIEEFRALRVAFGLPHFELDSYVRSGQVTFTWRPLPGVEPR
jgi:hypothetical protein